MQDGWGGAGGSGMGGIMGRQCFLYHEMAFLCVFFSFFFLKLNTAAPNTHTHLFFS